MRRIYLVLLTIWSTLFCSCHKDHNNPAASPLVIPVLTTTTPTDITASSAVSGGSFTTNGTLTITSRGMEYDTSNSFPNHWTATAGNGIGTFTSDMSGLMASTSYYIRAFASADTSTYYGNILQFKTTYNPGNYTVATVAGTGAAGLTNGDTSVASLNLPFGVAVDGTGNLYVADSKNNAVRKVTPGGIVSTLAIVDGSPQDLVVDSSGNIYVAESTNKILKITPGGQVSTFAGSGAQGHADGTGMAAIFSAPVTLAIDPAENLYVGDRTSFRKITPEGVVSTLPSFPSITNCFAIAVDKYFNIYETNSLTIIKVDSTGAESFFAGSGQTGSSDGTGSAASFNSITELRTDASGNIYVADISNNKIRLITPSGAVSTLAGTGASGSTDGNSAIATFNNPIGLAIDDSGNVFVADANNNKIRKISPL